MSASQLGRQAGREAVRQVGRKCRQTGNAGRYGDPKAKWVRQAGRHEMQAGRQAEYAHKLLNMLLDPLESASHEND